MEYKRIFTDGSNLLVGKIGTVAIGLINLMLLSRVLTTEEMGKYSLFLMIVNLTLTAGLNWSDSSIIRHGREEFVKHKKINQSFWARLSLLIPITIIITSLIIVFRGRIAEYIGIETSLVLFVTSMFIFNGLINSITSIYQSIDKMKRSAYVLLSQKLFYLIGLCLIFFNIYNSNLNNILIFLNISFLISLLINIMIFDFKVIFPFRYNKEYLRKIWSYSWPQFFGFSGLYIINYVDLYVIKKYLTLEDVGIYSIAYNGFTMICGIIIVMNTIFLPLIVEYRTKMKYDLIRKYLHNTPLFVGFWFILILAGIILSEYIIPLIFSAKYIPSIPSFKILLLTTVLYFISIYFLPLVNAFDLIIYSQVFNIIKSVINIIGDFILVPILGVMGAAYGTFISYACGLMFTIMLLYFKRRKIWRETS